MKLLIAPHSIREKKRPSVEIIRLTPDAVISRIQRKEKYIW
jgi:hypothetical protein